MEAPSQLPSKTTTVLRCEVLKKTGQPKTQPPGLRCCSDVVSRSSSGITQQPWRRQLEGNRIPQPNWSPSALLPESRCPAAVHICLYWGFFQPRPMIRTNTSEQRMSWGAWCLGFSPFNTTHAIKLNGLGQHSGINNANQKIVLLCICFELFFSISGAMSLKRSSTIS